MALQKSDERVVELLTLILRVMAIQAAGSRSVTDAARQLKIAGLDNLTIANVLNTSTATIRTLTSNLKAKGGRRLLRKKKGG